MADPVSGGTIGREDQGVDISAPPGSAVSNIFGGPIQLVGVIRDWYQGQPYEWFKVLSGKLKNQYVYGAEQIDFTTDKPGTIFQQGSRIGRIASSGTGTEFGFATASGQTEAQATTGYTEGQATSAGQRFMSSVVRGSVGGAISGGGGGLSLSQTWIQAGGDPKVANIMAAIAMAESGGKVDEQSPPNYNGTIDRGLWQINSSHSEFDANRLLSDPLYNAQAAVAVYKQQGLPAWTTYNTGAYKKFLGNAGISLPKYGGTRPGGSPGGGGSGQTSQDAFDAAWKTALDPSQAHREKKGDTGIIGFFSDLGKTVGGIGPDPTGAIKDWANWEGDQLTQAWDSLAQPFNTVDDAWKSMVKVIQFVGNAMNILRMVEFIVGLILMFIGMRSTASGVSPVESTGASIARVTREVVAATPAGRARRMAYGRKMGRREGEIEHARLKERKVTRAREAGRES